MMQATDKSYWVEDMGSPFDLCLRKIKEGPFYQCRTSVKRRPTLFSTKNEVKSETLLCGSGFSFDCSLRKYGSPTPQEGSIAFRSGLRLLKKQPVASASKAVEGRSLELRKVPELA